MKRLILSLLLALLPLVCFAQSAPVGSPTLWERAAIGDIPGLQLVRLEGYNGGITTSYELLWAESAAYTIPTAALSTPYCASASANDAAAGTGARTIRVSGLDTSYARFNEIVTLNGLTSVNLATANVLMIQSIEVLTAGSGGINAGIIQCGTGTNTSGDPAVPHAFLAASSDTVTTAQLNRSRMFLYGVPAAHKLVCRRFVVGNVFVTAAAAYSFVIDVYESGQAPKRYAQFLGHNTGMNPGVYDVLVTFPGSSIIAGKAAGPSGTLTGPIDVSAECLLIADSFENSAQNLL